VGPGMRRPHLLSRAALLAGLSIIGCIGTSSDPEHESSAASAVVTPVSLQLGDSFIPFVPGLFGYDRHRGSTSGHQSYFTFGLTTLNVDPALDVLPHDDIPDHKKRVRLTLSDTDPLQNPNGDITVAGIVYEANLANPALPPSSAAIQEVVHFVSNGTMTTTKFFDEITSVSTPGLGMNAKLEVEWWDGHEQEINVGVTIAGVDAVACEDDYKVYFNGQLANPEWDAITSRCGAGLTPAGAERGLYFPVAVDYDAEDAFHNFTLAGHTSFPQTWTGWLTTLSGGAGLFFAVDGGATNETRLRPISIELERQSDLAVIDAARVMMTIAIDPYGNPSLVAMAPTVESAGATAQLSPRGLDRLEPTHADTMTYPIVPAGTQPRLSQSAIDVTPHLSTSITVDLEDLPADDLDYWTEANPAPAPNEGEFAGYLAYEDILAAANQTKAAFDFSINLCNSTPNPAACKLAIRTQFCVENNPTKNDFRIRIDGINTYFDPARTEDALVIGDVANMDLGFGANQIEADFTIEDIEGRLQASIDPANIQIEWDVGPFDPCTIKPAARSLDDPDYSAGVDHGDWLVCRDLSFAAGSGTLANPIAFDIVANGEQLSVPFAPGVPNVALAAVTTDPGTGICDQSWLSPLVTTELVAWQADVEATIGTELVTSPGEDEALHRLLSPYELGVLRVETPPPGTPPYDVHPLETYDLSARLGKTAPDPFGAHANSTDGLYLPYLTRSSPIDAIPFLTWFCPVAAGQFCDGLSGSHEPMLEAGVDPSGAPFDVAINYTTAHFSHQLWAQARRQDHLGSPNFPGRLGLPANAVAALAAGLGFTDVTAALAAVGTQFDVRYYQQAAPYTIATDGQGWNPAKLLYITPNIVVELLAIDASGKETVVAKTLVDVIDFDHQIGFSTGGVPQLDARWGQRVVGSLTTTYLAGCNGSMSNPILTPSCDDRLRLTLGALWVTAVQQMLLDMMEQTPALQRFDAGQESGKPRHLKNVRTFVVNEGIVLAADLCNPANDPLCP
jgi:hypothetical protein